MTERLRLISISDQPREYLLAKCRVDVGQMSPLPVGKTPEIAFERRVLGIAGIVHSPEYRPIIDLIPIPDTRNNAWHATVVASLITFCEPASCPTRSSRS